MAFRIGSYIFTPSFLILPFALAVFAIIAFRALRKLTFSVSLVPKLNLGTRGLFLSVLLSLIGALAGAMGVGAASSAIEHAPLDWFGVSLSSFGFFWGALGGLALTTFAMKRFSMQVLDAIVPAMLVSGGVARIGCLYTGCCRGTGIFWLWPVYDIGALLIVLAIVHLVRHSAGFPLIIFLTCYGLVRFTFEFTRDTPQVIGGFTIGHFLAAAQIIFGVAVAQGIAGKKKGATTP